jgi:hypothetical protein
MSVNHPKPKKLTVKLDGTNGMKVGYRHVIRGQVSDPCQPVQVLVLSADGKWHLQKDAVVSRDGRFKTTVKFGFEKNKKSLHQFTVVATAGHREKNPPLDKLPKGVPHSKALKVRRTK